MTTLDEEPRPLAACVAHSWTIPEAMVGEGAWVVEHNDDPSVMCGFCGVHPAAFVIRKVAPSWLSE